MKLTICGIPVEVCRKDVKIMRLYVKPPGGSGGDASVIVSAPLTMSSAAIENFVREKTDWIKSHLEKFENQVRGEKRKYASGETFYVWGEQYILQTSYGKKRSLVIKDGKALLTVRKENTAAQREKFVREWYRKLLKIEAARVLPIWEEKTGLKSESYQVKYMISRWGSCKVKAKKISLSLLLAQKAPQCLEYVILHELLHFIEKRHNQRFKNLLGKFMPKWREVKKELNRV